MNYAPVRISDVRSLIIERSWRLKATATRYFNDISRMGQIVDAGILTRRKVTP
jgi:hypothetical protein